MIPDNANWVTADTSVVLKWYFSANEPHRDKALSILHAMMKNRLKVIVPDLLLYEVGNRLRTEDPSSGRDPFLLSLWKLPFFVMPLKRSFIHLSLQFAAHYRITYYDALFLTTAYSSDAILYTADEKLLRSIASLPYVKHIRDYTPTTAD